MSKLTAAEIELRMKAGDIHISDYDPKNLNPNSINLRLGSTLMIYYPRRWWTPWRKPLVWGEINPPDLIVKIPPSGFLIRPGYFYLGHTQEYTKTHNLVPVLDGRSSTGRLSLHIHATAGFGDIGFEGSWTLEIYSIVPVLVFPGVPICQIHYDTVCGEVIQTYKGRYCKKSNPVPYLP